jgi:hypothetical protein
MGFEMDSFTFFVSLLMNFKDCVITVETAMRVSFVANSALRSASFSGLLLKIKKN